MTAPKPCIRHRAYILASCEDCAAYQRHQIKLKKEPAA